MSISPGVGHGHNGSRHINEALDDVVRLDHFTVATLPDAVEHKDKMIVVDNGNAGAKCLAYSDGAAWLRVLLGAAVSVV